MLQLYYNLGSPPSRAVLQTIRVLGLDVEVKHVDLFKQEHLLPDFVKLNPLHQVPLLVDGDVIIAESRAIQAYLVNSRQPGSDWYPSDPVARALVDQRLYFDATNFFENIISILGVNLLQMCGGAKGQLHYISAPVLFPRRHGCSNRKEAQAERNA